MATNEILRFAKTDTGTNLLTQDEYAADAQRLIGNQPGVARSKLVNKALRQSSLIASGVAQFIANNQANNVVDTATPVDIADWIEVAVRSIGVPTAVAGGTADAITADFTPNVALTNGTTVIVRAGAANATTTPTFAPDGLTAKTIVKGNNLALAAGDIAGAGHWLEMNFDTALDKWVLQNPYNAGLQIASTAEAQAQTANTKVLSPLRLKEALQGSNQSLAASGYQKLPGGVIVQWGAAAVAATGSYVSLPIAFPNAFTAVMTSMHAAAAPGTVANNNAGVQASTDNLTRFVARCYQDGAGAAKSVTWIAIGY